MKNTTTGSVTTGITATFQALSTLTSKKVTLANFRFANKGNVPLEVASLDDSDTTAAASVPAAALNTIASDGVPVTFARINSERFFVRTTDADGTNKFEYTGE